MELGLTLGEAPPPKPFSFSQQKRCSGNANNPNPLGLDFGICMSLGTREEAENELPNDGNRQECPSSSVAVAASDTPLQLELLPFSPLPRSSLCLPWHSEQGNSEGSNLYLDVNRAPSAEEQEDGSHSRPHSPSQLAMDMGGGAEMERASSRASDEDENGLTRKKLRLSREQSAFLEESFKEHSTLNPKQKLALAKQLNLRPRQVEVWFQNRRARTKLKQTEVDCEYLKRCCEKLTEENRRLQKELQELRALKTSHPFYMHLPATTLTMCPSCERVASTNTTTTTNTATAAATAASDGNQNASTSLSTAPSRPRLFPFVPKQNQSSVG